MDKRFEELGALISTHRGPPLTRRDLWWILGGIFCFLAPMMYGYWLYQQAVRSFGLVAAIVQTRPWFMITYLFLLTISSILFVRIWSSHRFVAVYERGIRWRLKGLTTHHLSWQEIEGIAYANIEKQMFGKTFQNEHLAVIYLKNGKHVEFDDRIQNLPVLIDKIKELYYPTIYPDIVNQLKAGNELRFGPITVKNHAVGVPKRVSTADFVETHERTKSIKSIPVSNIAGLAVQSGFLMVKSENSIIKQIPVSQIPNFEILLKLFEQRLIT